MFRYGGRTIAEWLPTVVERTARQFDPERIVLFGSLARDTAGRHSDIDLLVEFKAVPDKRAATVSRATRAT
jgi:predicted nucleotidyltransferase